MSVNFEQLPRYLQKAAVKHRLKQARQKRMVDVLWKPFEGKPQEVAYHSPADIVLFGGAAGAGKSGLLLGVGFTQQLDTVIYRRKYTQLKGLIKDGNKILAPLGIRYVSGDKRAWESIPADNGRTRTVSLGAVLYESDVSNFQGNPHDCIEFDELPHFTEFQFRFLMGWLRTDVVGQRTRVLAAGNPPLNIEEEWIIDYWAAWVDEDYKGKRAVSGELRWYVTLDNKDHEVPDGYPQLIGGESIQPLSRTFIPGKVEDNPILMATGYKTTLQALPDDQRIPLLYGKFQRYKGSHPFQVIPTQWVLDAQERWRLGHRPSLSLRAMGIDVARGGADETILALLFGNWFEIISEPGKETPDGEAVARLVLDHRQDCNRLAIDVGGIGSSPYDMLKKVISIVPVNFGSGSTATDKTGQYGFANLRSEMWWRFREALDPNSGEAIALPPDTLIRADLCVPHYSSVGAKYKVEPKDDIKLRIGRSPDRGDALVLAWHIARGGGGGMRFFDDNGNLIIE